MRATTCCHWCDNLATHTATVDENQQPDMTPAESLAAYGPAEGNVLGNFNICDTHLQFALTEGIDIADITPFGATS